MVIYVQEALLLILVNFTIICALEVVYIECIWMVEIPRPGALHTAMRLVVYTGGSGSAVMDVFTRQK